MATINHLLLPVKIHFLVYFGALAGSVPFLMTYAQQLGASPSMVGVLYASLPFMVMLAKPVLGGIADHFRLQKSVFLACAALMVSGFFSVYFIPASVDHDDVAPASSTLHCGNDSLLYLRTNECRTSLESTRSSVSCNITCQQSLSAFCNGTADKLCPDHVPNAMVDELETAIDWKFNEPFICDNGWIEVQVPTSSNITCEKFLQVPCSLACSLGTRRHRLTGTKWIFGVNSHIVMLWVCMSAGYVGMGVSLSLADALTLDLLGEDKSKYGVQRLWGSIGWGSFSVVAGQLIDQASVGREELDFSPGFYLTLVLGILDIVVFSRVKVIKTTRPKHIARNVGQLMLNPRVSLFAVAVFIVGIVTGIIWTFLIVFLNSLGASQLLIGLVMATQCFLGELPFFFVSGWFLKKLGHVHSVILALFVFGVRFLLYSAISNPWTVLPIETTNGITYGIFFAALATYSSHIAPPGMSATVQGILQGVYEGFGVGVGCLIGGVLYEQYGGSTMFFMCGFFSVGCSIVLAVVKRVIDNYAPIPTARPFAIEIPEIRRENKEDGAVASMLNSDGVAA